MFRKFSAIFVLFSLLFIADYAFSTKLKSTWKNPSATPESFQFKNVLVVVAIKQPLTRKVAEDEAVRQVQAGGRAQAVASYTLLTNDDLDNKEAAKAKVADKGFDGAILIRYVESADERKYDPDAYNEWNSYNNFWWTFGGTYNALNPSDTKVYIETMLYSLKDEKLIWSGITETRNPKNPAVVVEEIAKETTKYLQKEGLIPNKKK